MKIFTVGYSGDKVPKGTRKFDRLFELTVALNATLIDVRMSPWSRADCWRKANMQAAMGERYLHVPQLGNINYNHEAEIQIGNFEDGMRRMVRYCHFEMQTNAILMCGCEFYGGCHRHTLIDQMVADAERGERYGMRAEDPRNLEKPFVWPPSPSLNWLGDILEWGPAGHPVESDKVIIAWQDRNNGRWYPTV